jgi:hypothetical protein
VNEWKAVLPTVPERRRRFLSSVCRLVSASLHRKHTQKEADQQIFLEAAKQESKAQQRQAAICYRIKHIFDQSLYSKADNEE